MASPEKFIIQKSDGTEWVSMYPKTSSDQVVVENDIPVMLEEPIGSLNPGDLISANSSLESILRLILQKRILPKYVSPEVSISVVSGSAPSDYEAGTEIMLNIKSDFTKNDAGDIISLAIYKNEEMLSSVTVNTISISTSFIISDNLSIFKSVAQYGDGAVKGDNYDIPCEEGQILGGSIDSQYLNYYGIRPYFYGADTITLACATSSEIRTLRDKIVKNISENDTFIISAVSGDRRITIAYPATIRDVSSVNCMESGNDEVKSLFTKTTIDVEGLNGYAAISYKVYTLIFDQPIPTNMTFKVTI